MKHATIRTELWHNARRLALAAGSIVAFGGAVGCATQDAQPQRKMVELPLPAYSAPTPWDSTGRPIAESLYTMNNGGGSAQLVSKQRLMAPSETEAVSPSGVITSEPGELLQVSYHANKQDVTEVLQALLGGMLNQDYVLDAGIAGQITIDIEEEMTRTDLIQVVEGISTVFGWSLEHRGNTLFIKPGAKGPRASGSPVLSARPVFESETPAVRVRRLRHMSGDQVVGVLKEFMSESAKAVTVGRTVVMADSVRQIARLSDLLAAIDVPSFNGVDIWTYRLANRKPEEAAQLLQTIAASSSINTGPELMAAFVPLPGTERLMVIAKDPTLQPLIADLVRQVDMPADKERRHRYKYSIQHYQPAALVKLLKDFFGDRVEQAAAETGEPRIRFANDPANDVLLIYATPSDYTEVLATLQSVDRAPQQVQLQSIIAEVSLTNRLQYGVEYFLQSESSLGNLALTGAAPLVGVPTGSALFVGSDGFAVIQALDRESDTQILSQPKVFMQDRSTASIQVGGEVPVIKASEGSGTQQDGTSGIREEIEYRKTGVILSIKAEINEAGLVKLEIKQEVTDAIPTNVPNQPEFTTRIIETTVVVPHGQTVLLGGIITDDKRNTTNRIPILGRIPVLGEAFKNSDNNLKRTELLLAITPTIVNEPSAARAATSAFMQSAYAVRSMLNEFAQDLSQGVLYEAAPEVGTEIEVLPPADSPDAAEEVKALEESLGGVGGAGGMGAEAITSPTTVDTGWPGIFSVAFSGSAPEWWHMQEPWEW